MWQAERDDNGVRVEFSATLANIDASAKAVEEFLKSSAYRGSAFVVLLLLREALLNAVIHASNQNPAKRVRCEVILEDPSALRISVLDQGPGFDWRGKMLLEPDQVSSSGRGLAILRSYAEEISYNDSGNSLLIRIKSDAKG